MRVHWANAVAILAFGLAAAEATGQERDLPTLRLVTGGHTAACKWLTFTPDGQQLISLGHDKVICLWDVRDPGAPRLDRSIRLQIGPGPRGMLYAGALSPDGCWLAVAGYADGNAAIHILDVAGGRIAAVLHGHDDSVVALAFADDGRSLASGSKDTTIRVWDLEQLVSSGDTGSPNPVLHDVPCLVLTGHTDYVYGVAFLPLGQPQRLVSVSDDATGRLWSLTADGQWTVQAVLRGHTQKVREVACSRDGRWIATSSEDRSIRLWSGEDGQFVKILGTKAGSTAIEPAIAFAPDSVRLVAADRSADGGAVVWSLPEGRELARFNGHDNVVFRVAVAPEGCLAASSGGDSHEIHLWNTQSGQSAGCIRGSGASVFAVAFSPDGRRFAYGQTNRGTSLAAQKPLSATFDLQAMEPDRLLEFAADRIWLRGALAADGYTAHRPDEAADTLVVEKSGREVCRIARRQAYDQVRCYAFIAGRGQVVVGSEFTLSLHEVQSGRQKRQFVGHTGTVWAVAVSPDERFLISGSTDQTVRLWSLENDRETVSPLLSFYFADDGQWVAWTERGYYKASAEGDRLIGWQFDEGPDQPARFLHAWQLRAQYYWPELVRLLPAAGNVEEAIRIYREDTRNRHRQEIDIRTSAQRFLPPEVRIASPAANSLVRTNLVRLLADVVLPSSADAARSVQVRVMVNDRPVAGWDQRPVTLPPNAPSPPETRFKDVVREAAQIPIEADVPLLPGENVVSVVAWTALSTGDPARIRITCQPHTGTVHDKPDLFVLPIGVSEYQDPALRDLNYADDDALGLTAAFRAQAGKICGKVEVFALDPQDPQSILVNERATRRNILNGIRWLADSATQVDVAVVCVSGHGHNDRFGSYFFVPYDAEIDALEATAVRWAEFQDTLSRLPCPVLLVMDSCHAAGVVGGERTAWERGMEQEAWTNFLSEVTKVRSGLYVFAAALAEQKAMEDPKWGHGALALAMIEGLTGKRLYAPADDTPLPADADGNGIVELPELRAYVVRRVQELTRGYQHAQALPRDLPPLPVAEL